MKTFERHWIDTRYVEEITDDFGIWQHATKDHIEREHGYAVDDAARALLVAGSYNKPELGKVYLNLIHHACCDFLDPVNFFTADREPLPGPWSPDALGQVLWAMTAARTLNLDDKKIIETEARALPYIIKSNDVQANAYMALQP